MTTEKATGLLARLTEQVKSFTTSAAWMSYLNAQAQFHTYSARNTMLILIQNPDATNVAGYGAWTALGRQVRRGEKSIQILAPMVKKEEDETTHIVGYRVVNVFDIAQTDGDDLPQPTKCLTGSSSEIFEHYAALEQVAKSLGFGVEIGATRAPGVNGSTVFSTASVLISEANEPLQQLKTLAHELGHVLLHSPAERDPESFSQAVGEIEAESVAYVVMHALGFDSSDYSLGYIAAWSEDVGAEEILRSAGRVQRAAKTILDKVDAGSPVAASDAYALA